MNSQTIDSVAENWYARLNKLKARYMRKDLPYDKSVQCHRLIVTMAARMMKIVPHYVEWRQKQVLSNKADFKPGGATFK